MSVHFARVERHEALDRLADRRLLRELAYVDGRWTAGNAADSFEVADPATGRRRRPGGRARRGTDDPAVDAAQRGFPTWRELPPAERSSVLRRWFELIVAARQDLALLMTLEQGKPLAESLGEIDYAASFVEWYAEEAKRLNVESVTSHLARRRDDRPPRGARRGRRRHALEFPRRHADAQGGGRARRRLHGRGAPLLRDAAFGAGAGRARRTRRTAGRRLQRGHRRCRDDRRQVLRGCRACGR